MTRSCGRVGSGALWLVHGWRGDGGGLVAQTLTISCGNRTPGVAFELPPRRPMRTLPYEWAVAPVCGLFRMVVNGSW